jgi:hypothetical protein
MSNDKQSSVDIFKEQLIDIFEDYHDGIITLDEYIECINKATQQAKEIEKERIREAMCMQVKKYTTAYLDEDGNPQLSYDIDDSFNAFYNETYGNNK